MRSRFPAGEAASRAPPNDVLQLPIPFGWFALSRSADLAPGDVRSLRCFGAELVLFRTEDGAPHATSAFCPHLGAHLGHGGRIVGDTLVCPFHGWRFDGSGICVDIPYAKRRPRRASAGPCLYSYPVLERSAMLWAWHHPRRMPPSFDLDELPELADPGWRDPEFHEWEVAVPVQEAGENAVDMAHFVAVHGLPTLPRAQVKLRGHRRETRMTVDVPGFGAGGPALSTLELVTSSCGPGMSVQSFDIGSRALMLGTATPITAERMTLRFAFTRPRDATAAADALLDALTAEIVRQVEQDIPIWEHKICRRAPTLCDGDGPIAQYRRWFGQFYDQPRQRRASRPPRTAAAGDWWRKAGLTRLKSGARGG